MNYTYRTSTGKPPVRVWGKNKTGDHHVIITRCFLGYFVMETDKKIQVRVDFHRYVTGAAEQYFMSVPAFVAMAVVEFVRARGLDTPVVTPTPVEVTPDKPKPTWNRDDYIWPEDKKPAATATRETVISAWEGDEDVTPVKQSVPDDLREAIELAWGDEE